MRPTCVRRLTDTVPGSTPKPVPYLIHIHRATFYKDYPTTTTISSSHSNPPLFPDLNFHVNATPEQDIGKHRRNSRHFAVIGTNTTPFLTLLQGGYIATPAGSRTYPYLSSNLIPEEQSHLRIPSRAIKYVGFNAKTSNDAPGGVKGAYLSARYESRREDTDWSLQQYLRGETELNPSQKISSPHLDETSFNKVVNDLRLHTLLDLPVSHLSNGQTRRSRIAKALLDRPRLLLLDEPFMGLDPPTLLSLSPILKDLSTRSSPTIILGLRPQDPIPAWITHLVYLGANNTVVDIGFREQVLFRVYGWMRASQNGQDVTAAEKKMAAAARTAFGPPPTNLPSLLTQHGIRDTDTLSKVWDFSRTERDPETGLVYPSTVPGFGKTEYERAIACPEMSRSASSWMTLTIPFGLETAKLCRRVLGDLSRPPAIERPMMTIRDESASLSNSETTAESESLIELNSIIVKYGSKVVLGHEPPQPGYSDPGLNLTISRGSRLLLLGPNGSGKTTLLSLLTSDHPQSYSLPIKFFGRTRLPSPGKPGLSLWEIQSRIGHSSPEVHAFFPKGMTVRRVLESAWAETFSSKPKLTPERSAMVDHFLHIWRSELCHDLRVEKSSDDLSWAVDKIRHPSFGQLSFGTQRLLLLLRATIKQPDIIVLDEGFSGIPEATRIKALKWLETGDKSVKSETVKDSIVTFPGLTDEQAIIVVSHVREEIPACINEFVRLPSEEEASENGKTVLIERTEPGRMSTLEGWNRAWGV